METKVSPPTPPGVFPPPPSKKKESPKVKKETPKIVVFFMGFFIPLLLLGGVLGAYWYSNRPVPKPQKKSVAVKPTEIPTPTMPPTARQDETVANYKVNCASKDNTYFTQHTLKTFDKKAFTPMSLSEVKRYLPEIDTLCTTISQATQEPKKTRKSGNWWTYEFYLNGAPVAYDLVQYGGDWKFVLFLTGTR